MFSSRLTFSFLILQFRILSFFQITQMLFLQIGIRSVSTVLTVHPLRAYRPVYDVGLSLIFGLARRWPR